MTRGQARRLMLWTNGCYILSADHSGLSDALQTGITEDDLARIADAQTAIGLDMVARSGIPVDATETEALAIVTARR